MVGPNKFVYDFFFFFFNVITLIDISFREFPCVLRLSGLLDTSGSFLGIYVRHLLGQFSCDHKRHEAVQFVRSQWLNPGVCSVLVKCKFNYIQLFGIRR